MKKVLYVTNEHKYVSNWEKTMTANGFAFDVALSASEALGRAESGHPDIIVLDRTETPPEVFINGIKNNKKTSNIPVIKITPDQSGNADAVLARLKALLAPKKVLIAEDDRQMSDVMSMILTTAGFVVKATHDGVATLKEIKTWHPHLLVLDIMLPLIDGFHICQNNERGSRFRSKAESVNSLRAQQRLGPEPRGCLRG